MKKVILAILLFTSLVSCTKESKKEGSEIVKHCPVIPLASVPPAVLLAFQIKYPKETVISWFQKDSLGYSAFFNQLGNIRKLAEFTNSGELLSEKIDLDYDGNFEDSTGHTSTKTTTVCECSIPE